MLTKEILDIALINKQSTVKEKKTGTNRLNKVNTLFRKEWYSEFGRLINYAVEDKKSSSYAYKFSKWVKHLNWRSSNYPDNRFERSNYMIFNILKKTSKGNESKFELTNILN